MAMRRQRRAQTFQERKNVLEMFDDVQLIKHYRAVDRRAGIIFVTNFKILLFSSKYYNLFSQNIATFSQKYYFFPQNITTYFLKMLQHFFFASKCSFFLNIFTVQLCVFQHFMTVKIKVMSVS